MSSDPELAQRAVGIADTLLNVPPGGVADPEWERPYSVEVVATADRALALLQSGEIGGLPRRRSAADRPGRHRAADLRRTGQRPQPDPERRMRSGSASSTGRTSPPGETVPVRRPHLPGRVDERRRPTAAGHSTRSRPPSRGFLGIIFVVLLFITIVIYGMWVATGVAAEKSSRVMELMISAASPAADADRQGRRDRPAGSDPVPRDRAAGARPDHVPGPHRRGHPRPRLGFRGAAGRTDPERCSSATAFSSCSGSRCSR